MNLGPHADFIVSAYAVALLIVGAMVAWVLIDHRRQVRTLADLEARGVTRRSDRSRVERSAPSHPGRSQEAQP